MSNPYSLNPARQPDETQEEYKARRATLQRMAKQAGRRQRILFNSKSDPKVKGRVALRAKD